MANVRTEIQHALSGIRSRSWRAALIVVLLAVSLGTSAATCSQVSTRTKEGARCL